MLRSIDTYRKVFSPPHTVFNRSTAAHHLTFMLSVCAVGERLMPCVGAGCLMYGWSRAGSGSLRSQREWGRSPHSAEMARCSHRGVLTARRGRHRCPRLNLKLWEQILMVIDIAPLSVIEIDLNGIGQGEVKGLFSRQAYLT